MPHRQQQPQQQAALAARPTTPITPEPAEETSFDGKCRQTQQNSYRLEARRPWTEEAVQTCLREVMHEQLDAAEYEPDKCSDLAGAVAAEIRDRIRELNFDRCKIACVVHIYEKLFQGIHSEIGYLWDNQRDHFASYSLTNTHIIATGTVFGIYYE